MLVGKNGGRGQNGHLFLRFHRLEGRPHGNFGFSETGITADQAIHRVRFLHILFHLVDCLELIGRFIKNKRGLKFPHKNRIVSKAETGLHFPLGIDLDQVYGNIADFFANLVLFGRPL